MKLKLESYKLFVIRMIILAGLIALIVVRSERLLSGTGKLLSALSPLIAGAILAFILTMLVNSFEHMLFPKTEKTILKKMRTPLALFISIAVVLLLIALLLYLIIPQLIETGSLLVKQLPQTYRTVIDFLKKNTENVPWLGDIIRDASSNDSPTMRKLVDLVSDFGSTAFTITESVLSALVSVIFTVIFAIYLVLNRKTLSNQFGRLFTAFLNPVTKRRLYHVLAVARDTFAGFFAGQLLQALIVGALVTAGMLIFGFPYAPMVGSAVGFFALLPMIGSFIGGAVGFIMIAPLNINQALLFLLFLIILLQLVANFIYPRVLGRSIGMPGIWVFAAVIVGAGMGGIGGILLGVPFTATCYKLLREQVNKRNATNKETSDTNEENSEASSNENDSDEAVEQSEICIGEQHQSERDDA
ncbi:MAG TPA: AI-2E family transporter [Clostridiaceae bacterium]|nr:AI-2E family transporter [Clostridiaceae bacterium]